MFVQKTEIVQDYKIFPNKYTYFGAIHYDIHLDMKTDYTKKRSFQKMSLSELETLNH